MVSSRKKDGRDIRSNFVMSDAERAVESRAKAQLVARIGVIMSVLALILMAVLIGLLVNGARKITSGLAVELEAGAADAVLASAPVKDAANVAVPVLFYDQKADDCDGLYELGGAVGRQFEWASCGYYNGEIETGLVEGILDEKYLPVGVGGTKIANMGPAGENFRRWFNAVEGESVSYPGTLGLVYDAAEKSYSYTNESFYPLAGMVEGDEAKIFTMNMGVPFGVLASGEEEFEVRADDDTWVFIGNKIVIDMGGVHEVTTGKFRITEAGEVYAGVEGEELAYSGVKLERNADAVVRIFHADRNSTESVFAVKFSKMLVNTENTSVARNGEVEVAYNPAEPGYIKPLGQSVTVRGNRSQEMAFALGAQVVGLGVLMLGLGIVVITLARRLML